MNRETTKIPGYAGELQHSDGGVANIDGTMQPGFKHRDNHKSDPKAPYQMPLTQEEQDIMDGKKGPEMAKLMKIVVAFGNAFGAERLVDLGGAPHCSLYTGTDYMKPMIDLFQELANQGRHVIISSHILHEVDLISDQVILLNEGYVVAEGDILSLDGGAIYDGGHAVAEGGGEH